MKILAFAASNSRKSINKQLAGYAASIVSDAEIEVIDLNDYEMPMFSEDIEAVSGQPEAAQRFLAKIAEADALVISFAEHNGSYTAAYKNIFDWSSRSEGKVFQNTPAVYLATSPGPGGAASVLAAAVNSAPFFGAELKGNFSLPSFYENFDLEKQQLRDAALAADLKLVMGKLK